MALRVLLLLAGSLVSVCQERRVTKEDLLVFNLLYPFLLRSLSFGRLDIAIGVDCHH